MSGGRHGEAVRMGNVPSGNEPDRPCQTGFIPGRHVPHALDRDAVEPSPQDTKICVICVICGRILP